MGSYSTVRHYGYRRWPALQYFEYSHCYECDSLIWFDPESCGNALCVSCAQVPSDVRPPVDVPLPVFQHADPPAIESRFRKKGYRRPCPKCGAETWTEGNTLRSCLNGHVIRLNGEVDETTAGR